MTKLRFAAAAGALWLLAPVAHAVDPPEPRERIEALEIDASGRSGSIRTRAIHLGGADGVYGFGGGACRAHTLAPATLEALHEALRASQPVRIHGAARVGPNGARTLCVERVTFFALDPT